MHPDELPELDDEDRVEVEEVDRFRFAEEEEEDDDEPLLHARTTMGSATNRRDHEIRMRILQAKEGSGASRTTKRATRLSKRLAIETMQRFPRDRGT